MSRRPLLWFAACFVAGSSAGAACDTKGVMLAGAGLLLLGAALALAGRASWRLALLCAVAYSAAAGERMWADARNVTGLPDLMAEARELGPEASFEVEATGQAVSAVEVDGDLAELQVKLSAVRVGGETEARKVNERVLVRVRLLEQPEQSVAAAWRRGDLVRIAGRLERPAAQSNIGGFDYRRYLSSQRIHWLLQARGAAAVKTAPGPGWSAAALLGRVDAARAWLGQRMDKLYPSEQSGYMKGLVLGIREDLDPDQFGQFAKLGLTHILAISGLHVAVFIYALGGLLRLLRVSRERMLTIVFFAVPFYVLLTGGSPSVMRAGIMSMLGLLAARMDKLKDGLHLIAAAAVLMLLWDPFLIENVSFQLSFLVTAGLIVGVSPFRRVLPSGKRLKPFYDLVAVTVVAQLVSFPVSIYYFNQFHLLSLPANLLLVPFISFIVMPLGAAALLLGFIWLPGGKLLAMASVRANDGTFAVVGRLAAAEPFRSIWASPPPVWIAGWYAVLGTAFLLLSRLPARMPAPAQEEETVPLGAARDKAPFREALLLELGPVRPAPPGGHFATAKAALLANEPATTPLGSYADERVSPRSWRALAALTAAALALLAYAYFPDKLDRSAAVSILDVGQGDSIYARTSSGRNILIDGGGAVSFRKPEDAWKDRNDPFEVGRKVVVPLLMKRGVHQIDLLVATHLDSDHIRGLKAVLESIPVKRLLWNGTAKDSADAADLLRLALDRGIPMYAAQAGQKWHIDEETELTVLWPAEHDPSGDVKLLEEQNGQSVTLLLRLYDRTFLLPGDIGAAEERELDANWTEALRGGTRPAVDVLKLAHHGSKNSTSEEWLRFWRPRAAVASAGANNVYGHPSAATLERLKEAGTAVWRTDRQGEVQFKVDKKGFYVRTAGKSGEAEPSPG